MTKLNTAPGEVFADPTSDFVFKRIFGTEKYKAATIGLLNSLITDRRVSDVEFINVEIPGETEDSRKSFIDVLCKDQDGSVFICEMQNNSQTHFRERMVYYMSKVIATLFGEKGDWDYCLGPTYVVAVTNFPFRDRIPDVDKGCRNILHYVTWEEDVRTKMPGSTEYFFLDISSFEKKLDELSDEREKWLFLLANSREMTAVPEEFEGEKAFDSYFEASVRAGFTKEENLKYTMDMMLKRDIENSKREAVAEALAKGEAKGRAEGRAEGREEERLATAGKLKSMGVSVEIISQATGLNVEQIDAL